MIFLRKTKLRGLSGINSKKLKNKNLQKNNFNPNSAPLPQSPGQNQQVESTRYIS